MHIHILGICGTFMGSLAQLAKGLGHRVSGCDANVYPPMSTQLESAGIGLHQGYDPQPMMDDRPDLVVIGNAMSRGNPSVEYVLDKRLPYTSGPQWLCEHLLKDCWVLAISGTHGKTTTSSMLAWILEYAGMAPGFLIGGVPANFSVSARLGDSSFFVVEADEYDSAFFDKRSKFVHYRPQTLLINNLEFDHADIFKDLSAIQTQFHHLVRTVPGIGRVIYPAGVEAIDEVVERGCWSETEVLGQDWLVERLTPDGSHFKVSFGNAEAEVAWSQCGDHNVANGLGAIAAAHHVGVELKTAAEALSQFTGVKRRMECLGEVNNIRLYDDFAHHPTAIKTTLAGLRAKVGEAPVIAVLEPRSNTMKLGVHKQELFEACIDADRVLCLQPEGLDWSLNDYAKNSPVPVIVHSGIDELLADVIATAQPGSHILVMSNGGFGGIHQRILTGLEC